jgi:hypothetical protein
MRRWGLGLAATTVVLGVALSPAAFADTTTTSTTASTTTTQGSGTPSTTTTTQKPVWKAPLTGLPDPSELTRHRSALTIKIDNTPEAHPQFGIQDADVVYEEIVEGQITRLAAIFNSRLPTEVGPVRSVRRTDREIVFPIGGLFAFSGGAQYAVSSIETAPVKLVQESNAGAAMFRDPSRPPPHNLLANAQLLMTFNGAPKPPPALFTYRSSSTPATGARVNAFYVDFNSGYETSYTWDQKTFSWDRSIFGAPDVTATGQRVSPANVIVMNVLYRGGVGVEGSYAQLTGSGSVEVFTAGRVQRGTWTRNNLSKPTLYTNTAGQIIALTPGQTWVELADTSERAIITAQP